MLLQLTLEAKARHTFLMHASFEGLSQSFFARLVGEQGGHRSIGVVGPTDDDALSSDRANSWFSPGPRKAKLNHYSFLHFLLNLIAFVIVAGIHGCTHVVV